MTTPEKPKDYCFRHAQKFEGWRCPLCEQEREQQEAEGQAAADGGPSGGQVAPPGVPGSPQAPSRVKSQAKANEAERLLKQGLGLEALDLSDEAVELDPTDLRAQLIGARASRASGDRASEERFLQEAVKLLRTPEYAGDIDWYREFFKSARDPKVLGRVVRMFAARTWTRDQTLAMVRTLMGRGATTDALVVLTGIPADERSLLTLAYGAQLAGPTAGREDPEMSSYLLSTPASQRRRILAEMVEVARTNDLSASTVRRVQEAVGARYQEWAEDIKPLISARARVIALERLAPDLTAPAWVWAAKFFAGGLVVAVVLALASGRGVPALVVALLGGIACGGAGYAYGRDVETTRRLPDAMAAVRDEMVQAEVDEWAPVVAELPGGQAPSESVRYDACPYCSTDVRVGEVLCPACSRPMNGTPPQTDEAADGADADHTASEPK